MQQTDEHTAITGDGNKPIRPAQQVKATAWSTVWRPRTIRLPIWTSYRMAILSFLQDDAFIFAITLATEQRLEVNSKLGFAANIILDWTVFFHLCSERCHFACPKFHLLAIDGGCRQHTYRAPHFLMHSCCTDSLQSCCHSVQSHMDFHAPAWLKSRSTLSAQKHSHLILVAQCRTSCSTWHHARALLPRLFLNQSSSNLNNPAKINGHSRVAPWRNYHFLQVMRPTGLLKTRTAGTAPETVSSLSTRIYVSDPCLSTSRSKHQPMTQRKHRDAPGVGLRRRTTSCSAGFTTVSTGARSECRTIASLSLWTRKLDVQFISRSDKYRETCRIVFEPKKVESRHIFRQRRFFLKTSNVARSLLDGNRDHLLAEAISQHMNQEYKVESLISCIGEHQQQTYAQWLELEDAHLGYVESGREQVRLQEELAMKEKALRGAQIRIIHEMGELKRAQELRVDEFSVQQLRESHDTVQRLTSQKQEVAREVNCMNDPREFQDTESNHSGKLSHVPSLSAVISSPRSMLSRDKRLLTHGICLDQGETF